MGGGDLNLKKSWHPSTLRNIERVWKAEQKHDAEQRKIEQLQKELQDERAKEEIQQFAEDHGAVKRKNERLDWMYQGPSAFVDREQYLVGRTVDKTFEVLDQLENNKLPEDDSHQAGAIFCQSSVNVTVDLANKIREDPLFTIRKKETEQKKNLLNNPVKMKQLRDLLEMEVLKKDKKKHRKDKSHKKTKDFADKDGKRLKSNRDYRSTGKERASRKTYISSEEENFQRRQKNYVVPEKFSSKKYRRSSNSSLDTSDESPERQQRQKGRSDHEVNMYRRNKSQDFERGRERSENDERQPYRYKPYGLCLSKNAQHVEKRPRQELRRSRSRSPIISQKQKKVVRAPSPPRRKLTHEEMEEKRKMMMVDAKWRDEQRERNVKKYKKEEEKEEKHKGKPVDFIRPLLSAATDTGSVEGRIRQKIFNLQRSSSAMNENFARK